jgi:hypothetical protein
MWDEVSAEIARIRPLQPEAARSLAYAASEILNNAVDHSRGRTVEVAVAFDKGGTTVTTIPGRVACELTFSSCTMASCGVAELLTFDSRQSALAKARGIMIGASTDLLGVVDGSTEPWTTAGRQ